MPTPQFDPGFRMSLVDAAVLIFAALVLVFAPHDTPIPHVAAFVVAHFFLFCNVVRLARALELIWAAVIIALAASTIALGTHGWLVTYTTSLALTIVVVAIEMRKPSYHGVGWRWINPGLRDWWEAQRPI